MLKAVDAKATNPTKKKILFVITQSEFGGAQRFLFELVTHLDPALYESIVTSQPGELLDMLRSANIPVQPLKRLRRDISPLGDILAVLEIRKLLNREKPDVLFLLSSKAGFLGSLAAWLQHYSDTLAYRSKIIYRIGGWSFNDPQSRLTRKLYIAAEKISARWKDVIIVNSEHDRLQAQQLGIKPRGKLVAIYNGIDSSSLDFLSRDEAREKLEKLFPYQLKAISYKLVGCIANFYKTKGLPYLIEAIAVIHKAHPDAELVLIGDGGERRNIETRIMEHGAKDYIFLAGHLSEAWRYLKAFDIFVLPSLKEGFPWVLLEAMAAEVPIVATAVGAVPEIITNSENGLVVEPGNAKVLQKIMETLLTDKTLGAQLAKRGKETVLQKFKIDDMFRKVVELL